MKQISTGAGLVGLGVCIVATAFITTQRGGEAFAQGTGGERRIVSAGVFSTSNGWVMAYRIWSDNAIDLRNTGSADYHGTIGFNRYNFQWFTADNGTTGFRPLTDVDMSGEVDGGDIGQVLLDWNQRSNDMPPPPIDCDINAPR